MNLVSNENYLLRESSHKLVHVDADTAEMKLTAVEELDKLTSWGFRYDRVPDGRLFISGGNRSLNSLHEIVMLSDSTHLHKLSNMKEGRISHTMTTLNDN